jgi:hypothetical protein
MDLPLRQLDRQRYRPPLEPYEASRTGMVTRIGAAGIAMMRLRCGKLTGMSEKTI